MKRKVSSIFIEKAVNISSYAELKKWVTAWAAVELNLLIITGRPGLQKSRMVREAAGDSVCWIEGHCTACGMYSKLYRHRDQLVVIDDVDSLYADRHAVRLLKSLCQTERVKTLGWHSASSYLERELIPTEFSTTSKVAIITNEWRTLNENVAAIEDRGHVIVFEPTPLEVHYQVSQWYRDQEVFDFIGRNLSVITNPSMRDYVHGEELKKARFNWKEQLLQRWDIAGPLQIVAQLRGDVQYTTEKERVQAFVKMGGGCQATYYNLLKKLPTVTEVPDIKLSSRVPDPALPIDIISLLKRRGGRAENN